MADGLGLACEAGGFHIDPWRPVAAAVVTHAHSDHARPGSGVYYCAAPGEGVLRARMGAGSKIVPVPYGERVSLGGVEVSFHPAGHVLGSAQVRIESARGVWVVSGDYKRAADPTCAAFEPVACDVYITEATFALPIYRWPPADAAIGAVGEWWAANAAVGRASLLFGYALGKAQRVIAELSRRGGMPGPLLGHGAVRSMCEVYARSGVALPEVGALPEDRRAKVPPGALVLAPPSAAGSAWVNRFRAGGFETGFVSGWMRLRGVRRRRGYDRGFVLSDHADWDDLLRTVKESGAARVLATHGSSETLARYLRESGVDSDVLNTEYTGEEGEAGEDADRGADPAGAGAGETP